jgi:hypothetical protein
MYRCDVLTEVPSRIRSFGKRAMRICCQTRSISESTNAQAPVRGGLCRQAAGNSGYRGSAPLSKGIPFTVSDSSWGHQRFKESIDDHSEISVEERDK